MENIKRITSALLGFPMVIVVLLLGNKYVIDVALAIVAVISLHEYFNSFKNNYKPIQWLGYLAAIGIAFIHLIDTESLFKVIAFSIPFIVAILFIEVVIRNLKIGIMDIAITLFGIFYIVLFIMFVPLIAGLEHGKVLIWYVLATSWGTDVFAYIVGRRIGKHKFSKISPKKSIEGCIAGTIGAVLISLVYTFCINKFLGILIAPYIQVAIISLILSIIGQLGDFAASSIKRFNNIKDFSNLIPGHGGLLDRIDSLIFIAPFAYIIFTMII